MVSRRRPWEITDDVTDPPDAVPSIGTIGTDGIDTDGDGRADTVVTDDGFGLTVATDLDGDGLADQVLRFGPDATVHEVALPEPTDGDPAGPDPAGPFGPDHATHG